MTLIPETRTKNIIRRIMFSSLSRLYCTQFLRCRGIWKLHDGVEIINLSFLISMESDFTVELLDEEPVLRHRKQLNFLTRTFDRQPVVLLAHDDFQIGTFTTTIVSHELGIDLGINSDNLSETLL